MSVPGTVLKLIIKGCFECLENNAMIAKKQQRIWGRLPSLVDHDHSMHVVYLDFSKAFLRYTC